MLSRRERPSIRARTLSPCCDRAPIWYQETYRAHASYAALASPASNSRICNPRVHRTPNSYRRARRVPDRGRVALARTHTFCEGQKHTTRFNGAVRSIQHSLCLGGIHAQCLYENTKRKDMCTSGYHLLGFRFFVYGIIPFSIDYTSKKCSPAPCKPDLVSTSKVYYRCDGWENLRKVTEKHPWLRGFHSTQLHQDIGDRKPALRPQEQVVRAAVSPETPSRQRAQLVFIATDLHHC